MQMHTDLEITQFIATKLCHDLAGTLGAINSGLDFMNASNPDMKEKAVNLVKTSSEQSVNRLVFYRHTYGIAKHNGEANLDEIKKIAEDYLKGTKVKIEFHEKYFHIAGVYVSANQGKLILSLIQQAYANLIHGGEILLSIEKGKTNSKITILAKGTSPKIDKEKIDILTGKLNSLELTTNNCTSYFTHKFAKKLNTILKIDTSVQNQVEYSLEF